MDDIRYAIELGISILVFIMALCGVISIGVIDRQKISMALTKVENAVHRLIRIENELAHLIRKNDDDLNGASSIVMEDDSVRGES